MQESVETITDTIEGLPNLSGWDRQVDQAVRRQDAAVVSRTPLSPERVKAAFGIALHMHQPLVFAEDNVHNSPMIGNLQYMMERQHVHGNHDAPAYARCYTRT